MPSEEGAFAGLKQRIGKSGAQTVRGALSQAMRILAVQAYQKRALPLIDWLAHLARNQGKRMLLRLVNLPLMAIPSCCVLWARTPSRLHAGNCLTITSRIFRLYSA